MIDVVDVLTSCSNTGDTSSFEYSSFSDFSSLDDVDLSQSQREEGIGKYAEVATSERVIVEVSCSDNVDPFPHKKCRLWVQKEKLPPIMLSEYTWVDGEMGSYYSCYSDKLSVLHFINCVIVCSFANEDFSPFHLYYCRNNACAKSDWVFLRKDMLSTDNPFKTPPMRDFFYVYDCIFFYLHVEMLFDNFTMNVLRVLNVSPSQLHYNGWATIQAFRSLCRFFRFEPTSDLFLHYFRTPPTDKALWLSLIRHQDRPFFRPFTSYKNFNVGFS